MKQLSLFFVSALFSLYAQAFESVKMDGQKFFLVDVSIAKPNSSTKFIVDTGASDTVLLDWFTEKSKIPTKPSLEKGTDSGGTSFETKEAEVSELIIGPFRQQLKHLYVVPSPGPFQQFGVGGILSPQSLFKGKDFLIDFPMTTLGTGIEIDKSLKNRKLVATLSIEPCDKENDNKYVVVASFNGVKGRFYLDSGGRSAALSANFAQKLGSLEGESGERVGVGSKREIKKLKNLKFSVSNIAIDLDADAEPSGVSCPSADGKIGIDFMKRYGWLFNSKRTKVLLYQ